MMEKYILVDREPKRCDDILEWGRWYETAQRHIGDDTINGVRVSTVFLGLDHSFSEGDPILFETMVFGGEHNEWQERYFTYDEAEAGHKNVVRRIRLGLHPSRENLIDAIREGKAP
jgi:hypothetical protein